jgi:hypothetical protein
VRQVVQTVIWVSAWAMGMEHVGNQVVKNGWLRAAQLNPQCHAAPESRR